MAVRWTHPTTTLHSKCKHPSLIMRSNARDACWSRKMRGWTVDCEVPKTSWLLRPWNANSLWKVPRGRPRRHRSKLRDMLAKSLTWPWSSTSVRSWAVSMQPSKTSTDKRSFWTRSGLRTSCYAKCLKWTQTTRICSRVWTTSLARLSKVLNATEGFSHKTLIHKRIFLH